ncbi:hypothetical protein NIES2107_74880 (plasmid) [Nostoc carneum NIES-2107]|nr:hypothetical protein NIES2107_74880 [Nostoc carneum NIES-2107]
MPSFSQLSPDSLFYQMDNLNIQNYCIAFLADRPMVTAEQQSPLNLAATWMKGVYLFLSLSQETLRQRQAEIELSVRQLLNDPAYQDVRFLWVKNPTAALPDWQIIRLAVQAPQQQENAHNSTVFICRSTFFDLRNYALFIPDGSCIELTETGFAIASAKDSCFHFDTGFGEHQLRGVKSPLVLPLEGTEAGCVQFELILQKPAANGTAPPSDPGDSVPLNSQGYIELEHLDIGLRLFCPDSTQINGSDFAVLSYRYPFLAEDAEALSNYPEELKFFVTFDPLNPLQPNRTALRFIKPDAGNSSAALPSCYRTNLGYTVHLTPSNQQSRLVFAEIPLSSGKQQEPPLYLVPAGQFEMTVPAYDGKPDNPIKNLLCGFSGVEYFKLEADRANVLDFQPGQPAFVQGFLAIAPMTQVFLDLVSQRTSVPREQLRGEASLDVDLGIDDATQAMILDQMLQTYFPANYKLNENQKLELSSLNTLDEWVKWFQQVFRVSKASNSQIEPVTLSNFATTSWAYVRQRNANSTYCSSTYYAQPDLAVLYGEDEVVPSVELPIAKAENPSLAELNAGETGDDSPLLAFMEVPGTVLSHGDDGKLAVFPLFPYAGVQPEVLIDLQQLEVALLNPKRQTIISSNAVYTDAVPTLRAATLPRVTTPQGLLATFSQDWNTIESLLLATDSSGNSIQFHHIGRESPLRVALQSNQLFLVISRRESLKEYLTEHQLTMQGWRFDLNPDHWRDDTVLILKFFDAPLLGLLDNPQVWSQAEVFTRDREATRRQLVKLFQEAIASVNGADTPQQERDNYEALARIAQTASWSGILAVNVAVSPPAELEALTAGMNASRFYARYMGIETTPIAATSQGLQAGQSSLFGLIDYQDENIPLPTESGYNFQVSSWQVLFQNSLVKAFSNQVTVTLDRLFDERTELRNSLTGRNIIILQGTAENHDGKPTYALSFSGENHFALPDSTVLHEVEIIKAQFTTDPVTAASTDITGRFTFWGRLNFKELAAFDIFSFGEATETVEAGTQANDKFLSFSNLVVTMTFPKADPQKRQFVFDPGHLAFDTRQSQVRRDSLYAKFPLKLTGLLYAAGERKTEDYGYMPVKSPLTGQLGKTWYGLTFDLELGSLGALAGKAGLVASLVAAWSPSGEKGTEANGKGSGVFVGLRLPGSTGGKREISIQGVIKIVFKSIEFVVGRKDGRVSYLLKLKNILIKFLLLSIPPNAQTEMIIFGDPEEMVENNSVGWYAAYVK